MVTFGAFAFGDFAKLERSRRECQNPKKERLTDHG